MIVLLTYVVFCIVKVVMLVVGAVFGTESYFYKMGASSYSKKVSILVALVLLDYVVLRLWFTGAWDTLIERGAHAFWDEWANDDFTSMKVAQMVELVQIAYSMLFFWILLSIGLAVIKRALIVENFLDDIARHRLSMRTLHTLCCDSKGQRQELFSSWEKDDLRLGRTMVVAEIDTIRTQAMRVPLTPAAGTTANSVDRWAYDASESVQVGTVAQMQVLAEQIRQKTLRGSKFLSFDQWSALFEDEGMAQDAWFLYFDDPVDVDQVPGLDLSLAVVKAYERRALLQGEIHHFDQVFNLCMIPATMLWLFAMVFVISTIKNEPSAYLLASMGAMIGGLMFAIQGPICSLVASLIFIFGKPYQVGDRVTLTINGAKGDYVVEKIHVLSTIFRGGDNKCLDVSTATLATIPIFNHRRTTSAVVEIVTTVTNSVTQAQLDALRAGLLDYVRKEQGKWKAQIAFKMTALTTKSLRLHVKAYHRMNWQQTDVIDSHKFDLIEEFRRLQFQIGIPCSDPDARYQVNGAR
ncbi:Mechanosensitive ion channel MscS domain-containing protein [Plasmodiophora brassicae]